MSENTYHRTTIAAFQSEPRFVFEMEDLKLEDDDHVPQAFGVGPIPKFLVSRELGLVGKRALTYVKPKEKSSFDDIIRSPAENPMFDQVLISPGSLNTIEL